MPGQCRRGSSKSGSTTRASGSSWWLSPGPAPLIQVPGLLGVPVLQHDQALHVRQVFFLAQACGSGTIFGDVHQLGTVDGQYALSRTTQDATDVSSEELREGTGGECTC